MEAFTTEFFSFWSTLETLFDYMPDNIKTYIGIGIAGLIALGIKRIIFN